jgi:hypothetical protein
MTDTMTQPEPEETPATPDAAAAGTPGMPDAEMPNTNPEANEGQPMPASGEAGPDEQGATEIPTNPFLETKHSGKEGEIEKIADDYVIPISDTALKEWAKATPEEFKAYAVQVAIGMYPNFAPQIQAGIPTRILLDPYIQVAQQVLGPVMTEPNWSDPKWSAALQGGVDSKTNRPIPMTLDEWRKFLMGHPGHGWEYSPQAHERVAQFKKALNEGFTNRQGQ